MSIQVELYEAKIMSLLLDKNVPEWANYLVTNDNMRVYVLKEEPIYDEDWNSWVTSVTDYWDKDIPQQIQFIGEILSSDFHLYTAATKRDLNLFLFNNML